MSQRLNSHLSSFVLCPKIPKKDTKPSGGSGIPLSGVLILDTQNRYYKRNKGYINVANVSQWVACILKAALGIINYKLKINGIIWTSGSTSGELTVFNFFGCGLPRWTTPDFECCSDSGCVASQDRGCYHGEWNPAWQHLAFATDHEGSSGDWFTLEFYFQRAGVRLVGCATVKQIFCSSALMWSGAVRSV